MDDEQDPIKLLEKGFDVVVMGTGLTETILSGILSLEKKKVLHIDVNHYYGGEGASVKMSSLFKKFRGENEKPPTGLDKDRDWNVDLIPKFLMAGGELAGILRQIKQVQENVQFQQIAGSYVFRASSTGLLGMGAGNRIHKVPSNAMEALSSSLMGPFEKKRLKTFLEAVAEYKDSNGPLYQGMNLDKDNMNSVYEKFALEPATRDFVGHAMALYLDDDYSTQPARATFNRIHLYASSVAFYGKSPYIYPLYGLGELPSAFTRLSAVHGGTYMLDTKVLDFEYEDGKVSGVKIKFENPKKDGEYIDLLIKTSRVIADPSYFPEGKKKRATGQKVIRAICVVNHPIKDTDGADSAQIIIPQSQVNRKHDIYVAVVSSAHNVCPKGYYLAIVSTVVETDNPHQELKPGLDLLEPIEEVFMSKPTVLYEQADDASDNIFLSRSFDATSHFETCTDDVKDMYKRMEGKDLNIASLAPPAE